MSRRKLCVGVAAVVLVAALSLGLVYGVFQGQPGATTGEEPALASADGANEGIQVHGHWTIEVREPDGTLVSRQEFDNMLVPDVGAARLSEYLARQKTVGLWMVMLANSIMAESPFRDDANDPSNGWLVESSSSQTGANDFSTLTVTVPGSGPNAGKLVLSGTATAAAAGSIDIVATRTYGCAPSVAPASCTEETPSINLTWTTITPVALEAGQQVLVEVVISFS